jgi:hypothetical protein
MAERKPQGAGPDWEELLRAYFLRSGFFVVRAVPLAYDSEDMTDVDLLLYEQSTGATRRVHIVDIKYKAKPKAAERLFWTRGLVEALDVDGAYVATTDSRPVLRKLANKLDLVLIDGADLKRIQESPQLRMPERMTDEQLVEHLKRVDESRRDKKLQEARKAILGALSSGFGPASAVHSLSAFESLAHMTTGAYPRSDTAAAAGRLSYLAAAVACACLDYVSVGAAFRSVDEKKELLLKAIRHGASDSDAGQRELKIAMRLIERYSAGGSAAARQIQDGLNADLKAIPAEIVADQAARMLKDGALFSTARELEAAAYANSCPSFDSLPSTSKAMIGALLDFASVRRESFAVAWEAKGTRGEVQTAPAKAAGTEPGTLKLFI